MPPIDLPEILGVPLPTEDVPDSTIHLDRHTAEDEALLLLRDFVNELETILASKATPAQITTAVSALADSTATALGGKASAADLTALATTVGGKATPVDITTAVNALATSISGSYGAVRTAVKTAAYTAAPGELVPVDTTAGAVTVTLPTAPVVGSRVTVKHILQGGTSAVTVACGGTDVLNRTGGATSMSLPLLAQAATFVYSTGIWTVVSADLSKTALDLIYAATDLDRGPWVTGTVYAKGDVVTVSNLRYVCRIAHTGSASFGSDLGLGRWVLMGAAQSLSVPFSFLYTLLNPATIGVSGSWRASSSGTITRTALSVTTAPVGSNLVVALRKNGTTVLTLTVVAGSTTEAVDTTAVAFAEGDRISVQSTSVGSTTPAQGVVLQFDATLAS